LGLPAALLLLLLLVLLLLFFVLLLLPLALLRVGCCKSCVCANACCWSRSQLPLLLLTTTS
jgi:hypothetical protein